MTKAGGDRRLESTTCVLVVKQVRSGRKPKSKRQKEVRRGNKWPEETYDRPQELV